MAYVEVKAKTVEMAVEAAMRELGVSDRGRLEVEILQEPERGFLGFGGHDAIVKVTEREPQKKGGRGRGGPEKKSSSRGRGQKARSGSGSQGGNQKQQSRSGGGSKGNKGGGGGGSSKKDRSDGKGQGGGRGGGRKKKEDDRDDLSISAQEPMIEEFLSGLVSAFGLEGSVETKIEDDVVIANVIGEQTEALVGPRGSVMEAVHELTKTVLQRTAQNSARVRLDIAGYAERRRQALTIYAGDLIEQVQEDGGELMLEPMSASDRKVIHDAVAAHEGVRSYSEGEAPRRYVVIAADGGDGGEEE